MPIYMFIKRLYTSGQRSLILFTESINSNILDIGVRENKNRRENKKCKKQRLK